MVLAAGTVRVKGSVNWVAQRGLGRVPPATETIGQLHSELKGGSAHHQVVEHLGRALSVE